MRYRLLLAAVSLGVSPAAAAETPVQFEQQVRATAKVPSGLGLVRQRARDGDLTGALAAVERVIILDPLNAEARLLHASLLCRLDDRTGAQAEFDPMRGHDLPEDLWRRETAHCDDSAAGGAR